MKLLFQLNEIARVVNMRAELKQHVEENNTTVKSLLTLTIIHRDYLRKEKVRRYSVFVHFLLLFCKCMYNEKLLACCFLQNLCSVFLSTSYTYTSSSHITKANLKSVRMCKHMVSEFRGFGISSQLL